MLDLDPILYAPPFFLFLTLIELSFQYFSKQVRYRVSEAICNISCGLSMQLTNIYSKVITIGIYHTVYSNFAIFNIPINWTSFILLFIGCDFCYYWAHRMSHEINLLWAAHAVHHQSEDYNLTVALRQSMLQNFWFIFFYLPLAILGFNTNQFLLATGLVTIYQFWIHTESIKKLGPLEYIFNTPSHHRVHHGVNPKYIDKNHAGIFIIWDKLFGTFQSEEEHPIYGITIPFNSWNFIWANLHHYVLISRAWKSCSRFSDKLRVLYKAPAWLPDELGGTQKIPEVNANSYRKFNIKLHRPLEYYMIFQFTFIFLAHSVFFFLASQMEFWLTLFSFCLSIFSLLSFAYISEKKSWAIYFESTRILAIHGLALHIAYQYSEQFLNLSLLSTAYTIVSFLGFELCQEPKKLLQKMP